MRASRSESNGAVVCLHGFPQDVYFAGRTAAVEGIAPEVEGQEQGDNDGGGDRSRRRYAQCQERSGVTVELETDAWLTL